MLQFPRRPLTRADGRAGAVRMPINQPMGDFLPAVWKVL